MTPRPSSSPRDRTIRWNKLIEPRLQFRLIGSFAGVACVALLAQFLIIASLLSRYASEMPRGGEALASDLPGLMAKMTAVAFGVLLPATVGLGILITSQVAGPVHRLKQHLLSIARGERVGEVRLRKGDMMQDLAAAVNEAVGSRGDSRHVDDHEDPEIEEPLRRRAA